MPGSVVKAAGYPEVMMQERVRPGPHTEFTTAITLISHLHQYTASSACNAFGQHETASSRPMRLYDWVTLRARSKKA